MNIVKVENLCIYYRNLHSSVCALRDINLTIAAGEYVCIVGNNGAGKSSLIKSILQLVPINHGTILINCNKPEISYIPQICTIPDDFPATVFELVLSGTQKPYLWRVPFYTKKDKSIAKKAIETVNLSDLARKRISELSGGQRQRVLLARAICREPKLLVLDEPCAGLDKESSENFYGLLRKLNMENKTTIIMVSHDTLNIKKYAQRVIYLEKKVKFDGPTKVYFESRVAGNVV